MNAELTDIRRVALDQIERVERRLKSLFIAFLVLEIAFLFTLVELTDFADKAQRLLLVATLGSYTLIVLGLIVLGVYIQRATLRVLRALGDSEVGSRSLF